MLERGGRMRIIDNTKNMTLHEVPDGFVFRDRDERDLWIKTSRQNLPSCTIDCVRLADGFCHEFGFAEPVIVLDAEVRLRNFDDEETKE